MTVSELARAEARKVGEDYSDPDVATLFEDWVTDAFADVLSETSDWPFQLSSEPLTTSSGVADYELQTNAETIEDIVREDINQSLPKTTPRELSMMGFDIEQSAPPATYIERGLSSTNKLQVKLWPVPDGVYSLTVYTSLGADTLAASDTIPLPQSLVHLMKFLVRASFYAHLENDTMYNKWYTKYLVQLQKIQRRFNYPSGANFHLREKPPAGTRSGFPILRYPRVIS